MKRKINQKGAAMLLALFTVIVLASIATGFLAITIAENKTTSSRIDSELALEAATAGIDYLAMVATSQPGFWDYDSLPASANRRGTFSFPKFNDPNYFVATQDPSHTTFYMVYDLKSKGKNDTATNGPIRLSLGSKTTDGKIVGCTIIVQDAPGQYPDIVASCIGYVINAPGVEVENVDLADSNIVFYSSRAIQVILKEVSYYNYTYIYKNFTDLDLPFNVPSTHIQDMQNMVGLCPDTVINGGIRAEGYDDPNSDPNSNRVARLLIWDADGNPINGTADPNSMATINGPVRLVSNDKYDGTGPDVVDNQIGSYKLNADMKSAFQGSSFVTGSDRRGVPGANDSYMTSIISATNGSTVNTSNRYSTIVDGDGKVQGLSIYNGDVYQDPENTDSNREDLDHDGNKDYSKNICKMSFYSDTSTSPPKPKVEVKIYNRYEGGQGKNSGNIDTITSKTPISSNTYELSQDTVIYVKGGNVMVEGEVASGISVVCDDSRTDPANTTGSIDDILPDPNSYTYTPNAVSGTQADLDNKNKFFRNLEKDNLEGTPASEGNIFVAGDVTYKDETTAAMGLVAENYMYLHELKSSNSLQADKNDDPAYVSGSGDEDGDYRHLQLRGQLNSIRQSVQFDFFNYLGENGFFDAGGAGSEGFNGSLDFKGQMVGNQTDVEGDTKGRGYASDMKISYDESLKYYTAPMFFNEDYSQLPAGLLQFTVTAFFDRGSLGSK